MRNIIPVLAITLAAWVAPATAGAFSVSACANPAASALDQYCEVVPASTGAKPPQPGAPSLGSTLPRRVVRAISAPDRPGRVAAQARRRLLTLPAPAASASITASGAAPTASVSSLSPAMIAIVVATALALIAAAIARRRLQRASAA